MSRPRELPVFFIDHCLGTQQVAARLRGEGVEARVLVEEGFPEDADDVEWLPIVASKGWAVLTKDKRIRRRAIEREAILASGAGAFVLVASGPRGEAIAEAFARAQPRMIRFWQMRARPFIAAVSAQGNVTMLEGGARRCSIGRGTKS